MTVVSEALVEVFTREGVIHVDTQGERKFNAENAYALASRLIDAAASCDEICPLEPFHDQLVVKIIEETDRKSGGGVHIPDTAQDVCLRGVILKVGPKVALARDESGQPLFIEPPAVGDLISFSRHAGTVTQVGDKKYLTMKCIYALTKIVVDGNPV